MAATHRVAIKAAKQTAEILAAVEGLAVEVAEMKARLSRPETVELEVTMDRSGDILAAVNGASAEAGEQLERILDAVSTIVAEIIIIKSETVRLHKFVESDRLATVAMREPPATTRRAKK